MFKRAFFDIASTLPIQYKVIVLDKQISITPALRSQPKQLYCELIRRLLYDNSPPLSKATMVIDEAVAKIHRKEFDSTLRQHLSKNVVRKIRQQRSQGNDMIQIADMIAGSIFRKYERDDDQFYAMIKRKECALIEF